MVSANLRFVMAYQEDGAFGVLGDNTRRAIVLPARRGTNVGRRARGDRCRSAGRRCPSTSRCSRTPAWSTEHAEGTRRIYRLNEAGVAALRDQLDTFWNRALGGFQDVADQRPRSNR